MVNLALLVINILGKMENKIKKLSFLKAIKTEQSNQFSVNICFGTAFGIKYFNQTTDLGHH